ncbi:VOC family protein [Shewanella cyperi]|uniref:VOC family protein n=1 Tax=Shewanella cyperi TaxID=2814292 RepID=UPI001A94C9C9|nr:VOC family protein [Shewanella cyperi]QSX42201.1 VOC family protein [Shewanella cyperi]
MAKHHSINYLELPARDLEATKGFFSAVFGWQFQDYGPDYSCVLDAGIDGGFFRAEADFNTQRGCPLLVIYSADLEVTEASVVAKGGEIIKPVFSFPGGRRFHFTDPSGNEFAVWSE